MKNVIKKIKDPRSRLTHIDRHIAMVTKQPTIPKPTYYHNTETEENYYWVAGALGWPHIKPGFGLVIAIVKSDPIYFKAIEEFEHANIGKLLKWAVDIRQKYGFPKSGLLSYWYGDIERFMSILSHFNQRMNLKEEAGLYITPPYDFEMTNAFEIYLSRIKSCLSGQKTLYFGQAKDLINHIKNLPPDIVTGKIADHPAVSALGFILHSLSISKPWELSVDEYQDRVQSTFEDYAVQHERDTMRWLEGSDPFFPDEEIETEDVLISTAE